MEQYRINKVWVDDAHVWAETTNGWKAGYPFKQWRNLANATQEQRQNFFLSRYGIHWPCLQMQVYANARMARTSYITKLNL